MNRMVQFRYRGIVPYLGVSVKFSGMIMKFIYRGLVIFDYQPELRLVTVRQNPDYRLPNFNLSCFQPEDYSVISQFFDIVHRHLKGEDVELKDTILN